MREPTGIQPPSVFLPHIKRIRNCSRDDLAKAVARLKRIYMHPQVRGSIRRRFSETAHSLIATAKLDSIRSDRDPTLLSTDPFERNFTIQWLTRLISLNSDQQKEGEVEWDNENLEQAAALLAACAGTAASGRIERIFSFPFIPPESISPREGSLPMLPSVQEREMVVDGSSSYTFKDSYDEIQVVLHDSPLETSDISSLGVQTWGGSCVLAEMIAEHPENFGIHGANCKFAGRMPRCFRALELGSGTGLASLVLGKVLERVRTRTPRWHGRVLGEPDIPLEKDALDMVVATDFHPSVLANLKDNVERNFPRNSGSSASSIAGPQVFALPLDWRSIYKSSSSIFHQHCSDTNLSPSGDTYNAHPITNTPVDIPDSPLFDVRFDLIIGADVVYEASHAQWVRSCVERFLRKPCTTTAKLVPNGGSSNPLAQCATTSPDLDSAYFHLIIPLRRTHYFESSTVDEAFANSSKILALREETQSSASVLAIVGQEDIVCDSYTGEDDEVIYRYFKIGWV